MRKQHEFRPLSHALLRIPSFSVDTYLAILRDPSQTKEGLYHFFKDGFARDAIAYMAPTYWNRVQPRVDECQLTDDDVSTLLRYVNRMCFRATPLGMSATVSAMAVSIGEFPTVPGRESVRLDVNIDEMQALALLNAKAENLHRNEEFVANDTIYEMDGELRFVKLEVGPKGSTTMLSSVQPNPYLSEVLTFASCPRSLENLVQHLISVYPEDAESEDELKGFVEQLVEEQLLTQDHLYSLTDQRQIATEITAKQPTLHAKIETTLSLIASRKCDLASGNLLLQHAIGGVVESLDEKPILRIDTWRDLPTSTGIPGSLLREIDLTMKLLSGLAEEKVNTFETMIQRWEASYGDADLPLMLVVDEANGLYSDTSRMGDSIVRNLPRHRATGGSVFSLVQEAISEGYRPGCDEVVISEASIKNFLASRNKTAPTGPQSATGWFRFLESTSDGRLVANLTGFGTWPTGRLLGRFCSGDSRLQTMLMPPSDEDRDTVVAELVYHPRARTANICRRPVLSKYEITIRTGVAPSATRLTLSDLFVCRVGSKLKLRSRSLGKWVELRLSTAHNHELTSNLKLYRFMVALLGQDNRSLGAIYPRGLLQNVVYAPRVRVGQVIVSPASWAFTTSRLKRFTDANQESDLVTAMAELRTKFMMPEYVVYAQNDNELLLNLSHPVCLRTLQAASKKSSGFELKEFLPDGYKPGLTGEGGAYNHECLITYERHPQVRINSAANRAAIDTTEAAHSAAIFGPLSEWVYFTIGAQPVLQDGLICRFWEEFVTHARERGSIDLAFYIRYLDERGSHLRVRLRSTSSEASEQVLLGCQRWLATQFKSNQGIDIRFLSYAPEWNRYGGMHAMSYVHSIFSSSSDLAALLLRQKGGLVQKAMWSTNALLDAMGLASIDQKLNFARRHAKGFASEYVLNSRSHEEIVAVARSFGELASLEGHFISAGLSSTLSTIAFAIKHLQSLSEAGRLCQPLEDILSSISHMHLNRMFAEDPRSQEYVFWDVARRVYERARALKP